MSEYNIPEMRFAGYLEPWRAQALGEVISILNGHELPSENYSEKYTGYVAATLSNIDSDGGFVIDGGHPYIGDAISEDYVFKPGEIFVALTDLTPTAQMLGRPAIIPDNEIKYLHNQRLGKIAMKDGNAEFLYSLLCTEKYHKRIVETATGSTVRHTSTKKIQAYEAYIPEKAEQEQIGKLFKTIDQLIDFYQKKCNILIKTKDFLLEKMFPQDGSSVPEIRFNGYTDAWKCCKVGDFYGFKSGIKKGKEYFGSGTPIVNYTDVHQKNGISASELTGRVFMRTSEIDALRVRKGDIFFTRTSENLEEIGLSSVMLDEPVDTVFNGFLIRTRALDKDPLTLDFKRYVFRSKAFRDEMISKSTLAVRVTITAEAVRNMKLCFPANFEEQDKIGKLLLEFDNLCDGYRKKIQILKNVKSTLLKKMFV